MKTVLAALACIVAASWIYLLAGAGMPKMDMGGGKVMLMPPPSWSLGYTAVIFLMWTVMMVAMMIPSAAPTILRVANRAHGLSIAAFFTAGYLIVWTGFSAVATITQCAFDSAHVLSDSMALRSGVAAGLIIIAAGLYQLSPVKRNCLRRCCSPPPPPPRGGGRAPPPPPHYQVRRNATGNQLRRFMPGLLLGADVPAVRRRRDEHGLDSGDRSLGPGRKDAAMGQAPRARHRSRAHRLGKHRDSDGGFVILTKRATRAAGTGSWPPDSFAPAKPVPVLKIAQRSFADVVAKPSDSNWMQRLTKKTVIEKAGRKKSCGATVEATSRPGS
jgi:hypothetical protein